MSECMSKETMKNEYPRDKRYAICNSSYEEAKKDKENDANVDTNKFMGIFVPKPHSELIRRNKKDLIIKPLDLSEYLNQPLYYFDEENSYGIIKLTTVKEIDEQDFNKLSEKHMVSPKKLANRKNDYGKMYAYEFDVLDEFEDKKPITKKEGHIIKDFKFLSQTGSSDVSGSSISSGGLQPFWIWGKKEKKEKNEEVIILMNKEEIESLPDVISEYNPDDKSNEQLLNDWKVAKSWYCTNSEQDGEDTVLSQKDIVSLSQKIHDEIKNRKSEGELDYEFVLEEMSDYTKELVKMLEQDKILSEADLDKLSRSSEFKNFLRKARDMLEKQ